jgi:hypothetical protein
MKTNVAYPDLDLDFYYRKLERENADLLEEIPSSSRRLQSSRATEKTAISEKHEIINFNFCC